MIAGQTLREEATADIMVIRFGFQLFGIQRLFPEMARNLLAFAET